MPLLVFKMSVVFVVPVKAFQNRLDIRVGIDYSESQPDPTPEPIHKDMTPAVFAGYLPVIVKGKENEFVTLLQKCLKYTGDYAGAIDGSVGPLTDAAIRDYQKRNGLAVDGSCGPKTRTALLTDG